MIKRLRVKFICINMALVMAMLLLILVMVYHFTAVNLESDSLSALRSAVSEQLHPGLPGAGTRPCFVLKEGLGGNIIALGSDHFDLTDGKMLSDIYQQAKAQGEETGVLGDYSLRFLRDKGPFGTSYIFTDISAEQATLSNLLKICGLILILGFGAFLLISILLARWAIRPVEQAFEQQKQFVADASHELKTPLTVILTNAEMLQSPEYGPEDKEKFTQSILDVSRQMRSLVEGLLQLARGDRGQNLPQLSRLDISALVENALLPFEPVYFEQGLELQSSIQPELFVRGDGVTLRQVVDILLDNGRKYASPGVSKLTLQRQGRRVQLRFFTPGTPLTAQQCRDIFKRFYRLDEARTMSGSYGLGLSIAQRNAQLNGGKLWAEGTAGGNVFVMSLPEL